MSLLIHAHIRLLRTVTPYRPLHLHAPSRHRLLALSPPTRGNCPFLSPRLLFLCEPTWPSVYCSLFPTLAARDIAQLVFLLPLSSSPRSTRDLPQFSGPTHLLIQNKRHRPGSRPDPPQTPHIQAHIQRLAGHQPLFVPDRQRDSQRLFSNRHTPRGPAPRSFAADHAESHRPHISLDYTRVEALTIRHSDTALRPLGKVKESSKAARRPWEKTTMVVVRGQGAPWDFIPSHAQHLCKSHAQLANNWSQNASRRSSHGMIDCQEQFIRLKL